MLKKLFLKIVLITLALGGLYGCSGSDDRTDGTPLPPTPPDPPLPRVGTYLVSSNRDPAGGNVSVYDVDTDTGLLTLVSTLETPSAVNGTVAHPTGPFLYSGLSGSNQLEGFRIDPATGALTRLPGFPVASLADSNLVFDLTGTYLYVLGETSIDAFQVDPTDGSVARVGGFPLAVPGMVHAIRGTFNPGNNLLLVTDEDTNQIFAFAFNPTNGVLNLVSQTPTALQPRAIQFDSIGRFLYVATGDGTLQSFTVSDAGILTPVAGGVANFAPPGALTYQLAFDGNVVYVGDPSSDTLNAFEVGVDGTLAQLAGFPVGEGGNALIYPFPFFSGLLYAADTLDDQINGYSIDELGNVTPLPGSPFAAPGDPGALTPVVLEF